MAAPLVGSSGQVAAVDMNSAMLAVARAHPAPSGATIHWQEGDAVALPFPDVAFDAVLCQQACSSSRTVRVPSATLLGARRCPRRASRT